MQRRLAAILVTDVVGYSRLMCQDETGTLARLQDHFVNCLMPLIANFQGRVIRVIGDATMIEFASVVDAVQCAVAFQRGMADRNKGVAPARRIDFRIGINCGDVIVQRDGDLHGTSVNIAARLEALAETGGIAISEKVHDELGNKLALNYDYIGERQLKNIDVPVPVYNVRLGSSVALAAPRNAWPRQWRDWRFGAAIVAFLFIAGGEAVQTYLRAPSVEAGPNSRAPADLAAEANPSIAVLPFKDLTHDREMKRLADGLTDNIVTALTRIEVLDVVAQHAPSSGFRGTTQPHRVGVELPAARYVLRGSLQQTGDNVRVTAQLVDTASGRYQWAARYDYGVVGSFDEIADGIATAIRRNIASTAASSRDPVEPLQEEIEAFKLRLGVPDGSHRSKATARDRYDAG